MILFVDDSTECLFLYESYFKDYDCLFAATEAEAFSVLMNQDIDLLIVDFALHGATGTKVADYAKKVLGIPVIFVTAHSEAARDLQRQFKYVYVKPLPFPELKNLINDLYEKNKLG